MTSNKLGGSRLSRIAGVVILLLLGVTVIGLQRLRERRYPAVDEPQDLLYVSSPAVLQRLALSFDAVLADIYWMRAIQYYGGTRLSADPDKDYSLLDPLLHLTTSLDPQFTVAYRFGAFFLSEEHPGGAGRPDLAIRLLEKAMSAHPNRWEYPYDVGFVHFRHGDYREAADWFERAADRPDAPLWLRPLAAAALTTGGDTNSARLVWRSLLDSEVEFIRGEAVRRLRQLDAIDAIEVLRQRSRAFVQRFGAPPRDWQDLMRTGYVNGVPQDPAGVPYVLDPASGDITVSRESPLWPLSLTPPP